MIFFQILDNWDSEFCFILSGKDDFTDQGEISDGVKNHFNIAINEALRKPVE